MQIYNNDSQTSVFYPNYIFLLNTYCFESMEIFIASHMLHVQYLSIHMFDTGLVPVLLLLNYRIIRLSSKYIVQLYFSTIIIN